ncbi:MAG: hypothetical protein V1799_11735 [bacterium]
MRTFKITILIIISGFAFLLQGCLDINSISQVNSDGSILRTIVITGDSTAIFTGKYPFMIDSTWERTTEFIQEKKQYKLTVKKLFRTVEDMNAALSGVFSKTLQYRFEFEKSFQWFFTVYRYNEVNIPFIQYRSIPLSDFVTAEEIESYRKYQIDKIPFQSKEDSLSLIASAERGEEWESRNRFEAIFKVFLSGVQSLNNPSLVVSSVEQRKEFLYKGSVEESDNFKEKKLDSLRFIFASLLKSSLVHQVWEAQAKEFTEIKEKLTFEEKTGENSYTTSVVMPGLITKTNAGTIEGNKATWKDFLEYSKIFEYTMWVESRQVNWWAVILTGVIVSALLIGVAVSMIAKRKRR